MFTVVIAEKSHIDAIEEYGIFLKPLLKKSNIHFCEWVPGENNLTLSVPNLRETVGSRDEWRAILLCDESGIGEKNPFDQIKPQLPKYPELIVPSVKDEEEITKEEVDKKVKEAKRNAKTAQAPAAPVVVESREALLERLEAEYEEKRKQYFVDLKDAKFKAFAEASNNPLTRLATFLCYDKAVIHGKDTLANEDPAFAEYIEESKEKERLRKEILDSDVKMEIAAPVELVCIAKRTYTEEEYDINNSWASHMEGEYSKFTDWNMYYNKMRYLIFDILPKNHRNYTNDYIKFLYTILLVAEHEAPRGALRSDRVYNITCENNKEALDSTLSLYDAKLAMTEEILEGRLRELKNKPFKAVEDEDVQATYCTETPVLVSSAQHVSRDGFYAKPKQIGLTGNCPRNELTVWGNTFDTAKKTLALVMKQSKRAVRKAAADMHTMINPDLNKAGLLNEFQVEDVTEFTDHQERAMVDVPTRDLGNMSEFLEEMEKQNKMITKAMMGRMTRNTALVIGIVSILIYLIGFLPLLLSNYASDTSKMVALIIIGVVTLLMVLLGILRLLIFRSHIRKMLKEYNGIMRDIEEDIDDTEKKFTEYLTHTLSSIKGFAVLEFLGDYKDPNSQKMLVIRKHLADIRRNREELKDIYGSYISGTYVFGEDQLKPYEFNFDRGVDYTYEIPFNTDHMSRMEFMQPGNTVYVPIDFLERIVLRREELYE
ncbi:MAG: hypothetical protein MJ114_00720 [Acetatifactor sp.]|nr:hypothetical protein [Acetatifactor sp.]